VIVHTPEILTPPGDGTSLPVEDVFERLEEMADRWPHLTFVLDPNAGGEQLAQRLDAELENVTMSTYSQKAGPMCLAAQRLSELIAQQRIAHPDDPRLNSHVLAAAARSVGEEWRFVKQRGRDAPIDACIALAMAVSAMLGDELPKSQGGTFLTF
jgi:phage terminase large subunit-like protein